MRQKKLILAVLAALATTGLMVTATQAQTNGMDRRDDRRDTREDSRDVKAACKAGDEKSRPECRQDKRDTKQEGRGNDNEPEKPEAAKPPQT
jgi:Ni/Co efflux regulator RcnB